MHKCIKRNANAFCAMRTHKTQCTRILRNAHAFMQCTHIDDEEEEEEEEEDNEEDEDGCASDAPGHQHFPEHKEINKAHKSSIASS